MDKDLDAYSKHTPCLYFQQHYACCRKYRLTVGCTKIENAFFLQKKLNKYEII